MAGVVAAETVAGVALYIIGTLVSREERRGEVEWEGGMGEEGKGVAAMDR